MTVDELLLLANIALGTKSVAVCSAGDVSGDGEITVDEILLAVKNALNGCPIQTATPTPVTFSITGTIRYYSNALPVPGVTVELTGATSALSAQTNADGKFTIEGIPAGSWQVQPQKLGDPSGITASDAVLALQLATGAVSSDPGQLLACDASGDGGISAADASLILQYRTGQIERLPTTEACGSDWIFVPVPDTALNQSVAPPVISGGACWPGNITFDPLSAAAENQDFQALLIGDCDGSWSN